MQEILNSKKKGDVAFRHKDFRAATGFYSQVNWFLFFLLDDL
jgi:BR-signaling kinase